ncbi:MAG: DegT/DnrJ/EryC1/StrS family aminotransferase [Proteobacteria bacterium]|nr:DegT/DnrJ/EryC1/StrS family aminotransferase [Pseudomonadota bacterium]
MKTVPFFNYPHTFTEDESGIMQVIQDVGRRGAFILQKDLEQFEQNLARYTGAKFALGVANGTDALVLALKAAGIGDGDEVIFCSHTFIATAASIHFAGAIPVPVECGPDHMIDPASVSKAVTSRTKAIMPTQLNGRTCDMDALMAIAEKHQLQIIEDAAQGLGSKYKGRAAGTFGAAGTFSFYPAKTLGCYGDGGAIVTNSTDMYEKMRILRDHGRDRHGEVVMWGYNSRLDNLQAAILDYKLRTFPAVVERRRAMAARYDERLREIEQIVPPPAPVADGVHFDAYQNYEIEAESRDELKEYLKAKGIGTLIQWGGKGVHQFKDLNLNASLPFTERMFTRCIMLPFNMSMSDDDIGYVCDTIASFYKTQR